MAIAANMIFFTQGMERIVKRDGKKYDIEGKSKSEF
jgi:hypothetical protein